MRITGFTQTPFVSHGDENMVYMSVADWDRCNPFTLTLRAEGKTLLTKKLFAEEFSLMLPRFEKDTPVETEITPFEDLPVRQSFLLRPCRELNISLIYSSHEDLGYCAYVDKLHRESYEYLLKAMELCEKHGGFRYMIEHFWWLDAFDTYATEEEKQRLKKLFAEEKIELNAIHSGVHTSWSNSEQLVREVYFSTLKARELYGACPRCAIYTDISGMSRACINARKSMGIRYMGALANPWRAGDPEPSIPPLFWWQDESGKNRVLFWYQRSYRPTGLGWVWCDTMRQYPQGEFVFDETKALRTEKWVTEQFRELYGYGFTHFPVSFYDDRELPTTMLLTVCDEMNRRWKFPRFSLDLPSRVMERIEKETGHLLPTLSGEITDQWADFATIAPAYLKQKRNAARALYDAELLSALGDRKREKDIFDRAVFDMCSFDEHCWATSSKHPQEMHRSNIQKVKKDTAENSFRSLCAVVEKYAGKAKAEGISVINTLPRPRKSRLTVEKDGFVPQNLRHQILPSGKTVTEEIEFSAMGVKKFPACRPASPSRLIPDGGFETEYYRVTLDRSAEKIAHIIEKSTGRELFDGDARFEPGQFIYAYSEQKDAPPSGIEVPKKQGLELYEGDVAYVVRLKGYEEQSGAETLADFIFYKTGKTVDAELSYKNATGLLGDFYDRYKKNYFFAFPFKVDSPRFFTETQLGERDEEKDYIPLNPRDFTVAQNYVRAENGRDGSGIALYSRDMPVFHLGQIKYNRFSKDFSESLGHVYLYASSNRCNNLIYRSPKDCHGEFSFSILPYGSASEVAQWSENVDRELLTGSMDSLAPVGVDRQNLRLVCLKQAEDGSGDLIFRFTETQNTATTATLTLPFEPEAAFLATNNEHPTGKLCISGNSVTFFSEPSSYTTVRISRPAK